MTDPIIKAIAAYQAELARYNVLASGNLTGDEYDTLADETYSGPLEVLKNWDQPVLTKAGAMQALELALDEGRLFTSSDLVPAMLKAAMGYFKDKDRVAGEAA